MSKPTTVRRVPPYRGELYWEREKPQEARTDRVALAYYPEAGKLQVSILLRGDGGDKHRGKTITLDLEDFALHPEARGLLADFLEAAE